MATTSCFTRYSYLSFIILSVTSCAHPDPPLPRSDSSKVVSSTDSLVEASYSTVSEIPERLRLELGPVDLLINGLAGYIDGARSSADTTYIDLDVGYDLDSTVFHVVYNPAAAVLVSQRFRTTLLIYHDGALCDLSGWKHFDSEWTDLPIEPVSPGSAQYATKEYGVEEDRMFPAYSQDELVSEVTRTCGMEWAQRIGHADPDERLYAESSITHQYVRFTVVERDGSTSVRYLVFVRALLC